MQKNNPQRLFWPLGGFCRKNLQNTSPNDSFSPWDNLQKKLQNHSISHQGWGGPATCQDVPVPKYDPKLCLCSCGSNPAAHFLLPKHTPIRVDELTQACLCICTTRHAMSANHVRHAVPFANPRITCYSNQFAYPAIINFHKNKLKINQQP